MTTSILSGTAYERVVQALNDHGSKGRGNAWQCPAHDDGSPSLSVGHRKDRKGVVLNCHAGCSTEDVVTALGLAMTDLFDEPMERRERPQVVAEYPYCDEGGQVLYVVRRIEPGYDGERKTFRQYRPDGKAGVKGIRRVLYRLPEVIAQAHANLPILVVEGEKDADNLAAIGAVATCNVGGAGKWSDDYTECLRGASEVVVIADRDEPGRKHAASVADSVRRAGIPVRVVEPARGKDVSDHLAAGLGYDDLVPAQDAPEQLAKVPAQAEPVDADTTPTRRLVLTPASQIRIRPVRWLWDTTPPGEAPTSHGRLPLNSLSIAAGGPGLGKSQFAAWMAAQVTNGTLPGELYGTPRSVIYAATEDSWSMTIAPRLLAAGADLDRVYRVDVMDDERLHARLSLPIDTSLIGKAAEEYGVALLIADPLLSMIDATINDYRATEIRSALEPLVAAADRYSFSVLGLAHFTKAGGTDPLSRVAGSGAFGQLIRALIAFAKQEGEDGTPEYVMSLEKNNLGREGLPSHTYTMISTDIETPEGTSHTSRFVLGPESLTSVREVMRAETSGESPTSMGEAVEWLQGWLTDAGGSGVGRDIKKAARNEGFSDSTIDRARRKLRIKSKQEGFGKDRTSHWYLPEALPKG
ncbi:AAA family ATPase (plasmid) [Streptomyces sp. NEAU-sy36]|uniref:ATP-binding protein n=1 Tax=unclassified Streptomyces TaxID=2593676 RepID=UPI0015D5A86A|nr:MULTISPECIES: AAA family ATPase [unclassified Streptomyces]QLJ06702.1 AAA family ATPase [Streptomyces sp. NEAU-sy36]